MLAAAVLPFLLLAPKPFSIVKPTLHQYEDGPPMAASAAFHTGESVFVSFRVAGFQVSPDQDVHLTYRFEALDPQGVPLAVPAEGEVKTKLSEEDKEWMPLVWQSFEIPPLAFGGIYRIAVVVADKLNPREAKIEIPVTVRGRQVEPSETLVARNARFLRDEEGNVVLQPPIYRPGEAVWMRFDITGYKFGEKNRMKVAYGFSIVSPEGKTMFTQAEAAVEQGESFYPKKYVPGIFSVNLNDKVRPGVYTIVLTLRDEVGGQATESKHEFTVQ